MNDSLKRLHASLDGRMRPEDAASLILDVLGNRLNEREKQLLNGAATYAWRWSSMSDDYARPVDGSRQLAAARRLFGVEHRVIADAEDPLALRNAAQFLGVPIRFVPELTDYKADRLNRGQREARGIGDSKRQYNRKFRALARLAAKADKLSLEQSKRRLLLVGRSGFAHEISYEWFVSDVDAACFVAYYAARRNERRGFSLSGGENPYDEVADMLMGRLTPENDMWMMTQVYQRSFVLKQLSDAQLGELLGKFTGVMRKSAEILEGIWNVSNLNREKMIVRRGNDSSTWNVIAGAYNNARAAWLQCLAASGAIDLLDAMCPGKVMRLMAADLAWWHTRTGGDLDPNTKLWAALPLPWLVLRGETTCTRQQVEAVGVQVGVDAQKAGWTTPKLDKGVAKFKPTPELVHGVTISDPTWAAALRRLKVFSGKSASFEAGIARKEAEAASVIASELPDWTTLPDVRVDTDERS